MRKLLMSAVLGLVGALPASACLGRASPLPLLLPSEPALPEAGHLDTTDLYRTIARGPKDGMTLTTGDGKMFKVVVLCGADDPMIRKIRTLDRAYWPVQARGVVLGDTLLLTGVWPAASRGPK